MSIGMDSFPLEETHQHKEVHMDPLVVARRWESLFSAPEALTDMGGRGVFYIAGGGLSSLFGAENQLWDRMHAKLRSEGDSLTIAGVTFSGRELELIGEYARAMEADGKLPECIDERLDEDLNDPNHLHVHKGCGAANAAGAAIGEGSVEDELVKIFQENGKMAIYDDMEQHHNSIVINVDLNGSHSAQGDLRESLKADNALSFNASINLGMIEMVAGVEDAVAMLNAMVKWNVQIARNIIGGDHNAAKEHADKTIIVVNTLGTKSPLVEQAKQLIGAVAHEKVLIIA